MDLIIDENLDNIFSYLTLDDLINASLVCRRWLKVIQNSQFFLKQLDLIILVRPDYFENHSIFPNGKYRNLIMTLRENVKDLPTEIIATLKAQSECIRNIILVNFDRTISIQALSVLRNVTKLVISEYRHKNDVLGTIDLPNLRHLELIDSLRFAEIIDSHSLRTLKIDTKFEIIDDCEVIALNSFLSKCHKLKNLTFSSIRYTNLNLNFEIFNFNLEALTIEYFHCDDDSLAEFLIKQKSSLKKLAISNNSPKLKTSTIIFSQLTLDELEIDFSIIPDNFNPQMVNKTVKKLTTMSNGLRNKKNTTEKIILSCNAVEELTILAYSFELLPQHIYWNLKNLKVLRLGSLSELSSTTLEFYKFKELEVIEIDKIYNQQDIDNCSFLVLSSPNLKTLKINYIKREIFTSNFFINIVTKSKNLREIDICLSYFTFEIIDAMRQVKHLEYKSISFLFYFNIKIEYDKNDALLDGFVLNFLPEKYFPSINDNTRLKRMMRQFYRNKNYINNQRWCALERDLQMKQYEHDTDSNKDVEIIGFERTPIVFGEIRMLRHK